jgi:ribosomal protein S18 acetylase RimI-like enzyme
MAFTAGMSVEVSIRPAGVIDATFVAEMLYLSLNGLADYLFEKPGGQIVAQLEQLLVRDAGRFGIALAFVAEVEDKSSGVMFSSEGARLDALNLAVFPHLFPVMGFVSALRFIWRGARLPGGAEAERDEYYISNIGVHPSYQGQGIGSRFLAYAEQIAKEKCLEKCSLLVSLHNVNAFRLYQRMGYQVVETVHDKNENLGYHRMVKQLH